jgi:hypothetical protein
MPEGKGQNLVQHRDCHLNSLSVLANEIMIPEPFPPPLNDFLTDQDPENRNRRSLRIDICSEIGFYNGGRFVQVYTIREIYREEHTGFHPICRQAVAWSGDSTTK